MPAEEPPEHLIHRVDLDGMHLELSAYPQVIGDHRRALLRRWVGIAGVGAALVGMVAQSPCMAVCVPLLVAWLLLDEHRSPGRRAVHVVLGPHALTIDAEQIPWVDVGTVTVEGGQRPTLRLRRTPEDLTIHLENEPPEHAGWLADTLRTRARAAREAGGTSSLVPEALLTGIQKTR